MIKLKNLLNEAGVPPITKKEVEKIGFESPEVVEDLSFKFKVRRMPKKAGILLHEVITFEVFDLPDDYRKAVKLRPYHLIFGENSLSIFDAFGLKDVAGLKRKDAEAHLAKLAAAGKTEKDDAFIAGLVNYAGAELFQFFNGDKISKPGWSNRIIPHECVHIARNLISLFENPSIDTAKPEWWASAPAFTKMEDASEEFFAEVQERASGVALDRWDKIKSQLKN